MSVLLRPGSHEFETVKYKLELSADTCAVQDLRVEPMPNPHILSSFEAYSRGKLVLETFVDATLLRTLGQTFEDVAQHGLRFDRGLNLQFGNVALNPAEESHEWLLAQVCVGRARAMSAEETEEKAARAEPVMVRGDGFTPLIGVDCGILANAYQGVRPLSMPCTC